MTSDNDNEENDNVYEVEVFVTMSIQGSGLVPADSEEEARQKVEEIYKDQDNVENYKILSVKKVEDPSDDGDEEITGDTPPSTAIH